MEGILFSAKRICSMMIIVLLKGDLGNTARNTRMYCGFCTLMMHMMFLLCTFIATAQQLSFLPAGDTEISEPVFSH